MVESDTPFLKAPAHLVEASRFEVENNLACSRRLFAILRHVQGDDRTADRTLESRVPLHGFNDSEPELFSKEPQRESHVADVKDDVIERNSRARDVGELPPGN